MYKILNESKKQGQFSLKQSHIKTVRQIVECLFFEFITVDFVHILHLLIYQFKFPSLHPEELYLYAKNIHNSLIEMT